MASAEAESGNHVWGVARHKVEFGGVVGVAGEVEAAAFIFCHAEETQVVVARDVWAVEVTCKTRKVELDPGAERREPAHRGAKAVFLNGAERGTHVAAWSNVTAQPVPSVPRSSAPK